MEDTPLTSLLTSREDSGELDAENLARVDEGGVRKFFKRRIGTRTLEQAPGAIIFKANRGSGGEVARSLDDLDDLDDIAEEGDFVKFYKKGKLAPGTWKVYTVNYDDDGDHFWVVNRVPRRLGAQEDSVSLYYKNRHTHKIAKSAKSRIRPGKLKLAEAQGWSQVALVPEERIELPSGQVFEFAAVVILSGNHGHYTCCYKCGGSWYFYNDIGQLVPRKIGDYDEMMVTHGRNIKTKGTVYFYNQTAGPKGLPVPVQKGPLGVRVPMAPPRVFQSCEGLEIDECKETDRCDWNPMEEYCQAIDDEGQFIYGYGSEQKPKPRKKKKPKKKKKKKKKKNGASPWLGGVVHR